MKFNKDWLEKKWVAYTVATCSAVVLYLLLSHINLLFQGIAAINNFVLPVVVGLIIAYVLNPMMKFFQRTLFKRLKSEKAARGFSVLVTTLIVVFLIVILMVALIPQLVNSIITLVSNFGTYASSLQSFLQSLDKTAASKDVDISGITNMGDNLLNTITSNMPDNIDSIVNTSYNIGIGVFNGVIGFILAIYFLLDKERLQAGFKRLVRVMVTSKAYHDSADFWSRCNSILIRYIGCDLLDGLIIGVANFIFMCIAGMPYQLLISVVVGVTNLAPTFGPILGGVIGSFILVLVNPWYALWFIIFTFILQTCDGYVIKPKLFGGSLGVPAVWILITIIVGGRMFGVWGIMLAFPFAAIFDYVYQDMIWKNIDKRKAGSKKEETQTEETQAEEATETPKESI